MVKTIKYTIDNQKVEVAESSTGSLSPWEMEFVDKHKLNLMVTSDMAYFMRVNDTDVYRVDIYPNENFPNDLSKLKTKEELDEYIKTHCGKKKELDFNLLVKTSMKIKLRNLLMKHNFQAPNKTISQALTELAKEYAD